MKKIFILILILCVSIKGNAQEETTNVKSNSFISVLKEMGWNVSEFYYGFLNQGVKTVEGTYETIKEIPDAWRQRGDIDYLDFGAFVASSTYEGVKSTVTDFVSGDPEKMGAATFDMVLLIDGGKQAVRTGIKGMKGAKDVFTPKSYHYTKLSYARNIQKEGFLTKYSKGKSYTTNEAYYNPEEAVNKLALKHDPKTINARVTILKNNKWPIYKAKPADAKYGRLGGGWEEIRNVDVPPSAVYDVSKISSKPVMILKDAFSAVKKPSGIIVSSLLSATTSQNIIDNATEGGHDLLGKVGIVIIVEESIEEGRFKMINDNDTDTKYVLINPGDIDKLTPSFIGALSENDDVFPKCNSNRNREEVISGDRNHRGL